MNPPESSALETTWRYRLLFSALVAGTMSIIIGMFMSVVRSEPHQWLDSFITTAPLAFAAAFPTSLIVVPRLQALARLMLKH